MLEASPPSSVLADLDPATSERNEVTHDAMGSTIIPKNAAEIVSNWCTKKNLGIEAMMLGDYRIIEPGELPVGQFRQFYMGYHVFFSIRLIYPLVI